MYEPAELPLVFRPGSGLRTTSAAVGLICAAAAAGNVVRYLHSSEPIRLVAGVILSAPGLLAIWLARRKVVVDALTLRVTGMMRTRRIPWADVLALEQTRRSFVIITGQGDVSAGWIAPNGRDLLFRKVLELAQLSIEPKEPRWGIVARYVRRPNSQVIRPVQLLGSWPSSEDNDS